MNDIISTMAPHPRMGKRWKKILAIVGTPVNQAHELEIAIIGDEPYQGLNHG